MELTRPAGSTTLYDLSNELILDILGNFCLHCRQGRHPSPSAFLPATRHHGGAEASDITNLCSMSLVFRRLSSLAQQVLYHEFIPGYGESWSDTYFELYSLLPFLQTVALNPARAGSVKRVHVDLNVLIGVSEMPRLAQEVLNSATQARGIDVAGFLDCFRDESSHQSDGYQSWLVGDKVLGILLACLPNLKTLSLTAGAPQSGVPASALKAAGVSTLPIETLEIICCDSSLSRRMDGIVELASSMIRDLHINLCDGEGLKLLTHRGHFPNLRNLCIANSRLTGSDLASFLSQCSGLETFSYESVSSGNDLLSSDAIEHLIRNKRTLHTLHLDVPPRQQQASEWDSETRSAAELLLASLNSFPVLRDLLLSSSLLHQDAGKSTEDSSTLSRLLPPSIVSLQIMAAGSGWSIGPEGFLGLARAVSQEQFPNLRTVSWITGPIPNGRGMEAMFADAGVRFAYDGWQFNNGVPGRRAISRLGSPAPSITHDEGME